jgi:hypothetical protein
MVLYGWGGLPTFRRMFKAQLHSLAECGPRVLPGVQALEALKAPMLADEVPRAELMSGAPYSLTGRQKQKDVFKRLRRYLFVLRVNWLTIAGHPAFAIAMEVRRHLHVPDAQCRASSCGTAGSSDSFPVELQHRSDPRQPT